MKSRIILLVEMSHGLSEAMADTLESNTLDVLPQLDMGAGVTGPGKNDVSAAVTTYD